MGRRVHVSGCHLSQQQWQCRPRHTWEVAALCLWALLPFPSLNPSLFRSCDLDVLPS